MTPYLVPTNLIDNIRSEFYLLSFISYWYGSPAYEMIANRFRFIQMYDNEAIITSLLKDMKIHGRN